MKLTIGRKPLHSIVAAACRALPGRVALPILSHVMLTAEGDRVTASATDFEVAIEATAPVFVERDGAVALPGKLLEGILKDLPSADVHIDVGEENRADIRCLETRYTLAGMPAADYPRTPQITDGTALVLPAETLASLIEGTAFACSTDETRAILCGAQLTAGDGTLKLAATDTHRLVVSTATVELQGEPQGIVVPSKALREVARVLDDGGKVQLTYTGMNCRFETGQGIVITTRLIDGEYPDFERAIPKEIACRLGTDAATFEAALGRVSAILPRDGGRVVLHHDGDGLTLSAKTENNVAEERIECASEGGEYRQVFDWRYLTEGVKHLGAETLRIEAGCDPLGPAVLRPGEEQTGRTWLYLLMPMVVE